MVGGFVFAQKPTIVNDNVSLHSKSSVQLCDNDVNSFFFSFFRKTVMSFVLFLKTWVSSQRSVDTCILTNRMGTHNIYQPETRTNNHQTNRMGTRNTYQSGTRTSDHQTNRMGTRNTYQLGTRTNDHQGAHSIPDHLNYSLGLRKIVILF